MKKSAILLALTACLAASAGQLPSVKSSPLAQKPVMVSSVAVAQGSICAKDASQLPANGSLSLNLGKRWDPQPGPLCLTWCCTGGNCIQIRCVECARVGGQPYPSEAACLPNCI
jgi:hypothetical protein